MNNEQMIKIVETWINALTPKGTTGIKATNSSGLKMDDVKIEGFETGVNLENSPNADFKNVRISSGDKGKLVKLLTEFKDTLQESPNNKNKLTGIFDKIYSLFGSVEGIATITGTISKFLGLN